MRVLKRILLAFVLLILLAAGAVVLLVGPWPLYQDAHFEEAPYYHDAINAIKEASGGCEIGRPVHPFRAGWAERDITPPIGHPMAGYGGRANDKRSTGVHETLFVRALALNDGVDTVVLLGSDMLQTLPNLLDLVEARIQPTLKLDNRHLFYTSSHTHGGPGGLAPGMTAEMAYGAYAPDYVTLLADRFAEAITEAVNTMAPARFAHGAVDLPEVIRNRARPNGVVDSILHFAAVEKMDTAQRLYLARYSAHATAYGEEMMAFHNDYAGAFQRAVQAQTGMPLLFMGGAVGAMAPHPPGTPAPRNRDEAMGFENDIESAMVRRGEKTVAQLLIDQEARIEAMGKAMADRLVAAAASLSFKDEVEIAGFAMSYTPPPAQVRLFSPDWRVSPYLFKLLGVPTTGRLQIARIGDCFFAGMPHDFGGEISVAWQAWARERGAALWCTSFSGAYLGYLTPDEFYNDITGDIPYNQDYEVRQMNWFGPNQTAYTTALFQHALERLSPAAGQS